MEMLENSRRKNLTPVEQCTFFLLLNLSLIICAAALNFYCAPNHFVFGGNRMKRLNTVLHLYKDASNYTEWFVPQVEQLQQRAVKLFLGWIWNDII